tara:strand:+ start:700 stop:1245 length:546 start_codon:yes stop_codon:yes gene_type:complete
MPAGLADTYIAYKFIKMLALPFDKTDAYKLGIIDSKGKRIKTKEADDAAKNAGLKYTNLHRIVFNMKRLLAKLPFGRSKIAGFAAALWFLKEEARRLGVKDETLVERAFLDYTQSKGIAFDTLNESFLCSETIEPGTYVLNKEKTIIVEETLNPIGNIFGIPVFRHGDDVFSEEDLNEKTN